jgi:urease accessory protein UreF
VASHAALGVRRDHTQRLHLQAPVRGKVSAAVRLALAGPAEAQRLQARAAPTLDAVLTCCADLDTAAQTQVAPLHDLLAAGHDHLYSRLFAS